MNLDDAIAYAWLLTGHNELTLQAFDDKKSGAAPAIRGGELTALWPWVLAKQEQGCGIFATVNASANGYRTADDITAVRALFIDLDGKEPDRPWHLPPSMVVQSGRGKHAYWVLDPWPEPDRRAFKTAQHRLARHYGSDPAVCDVPRVMRLPGTLHQKGEPVLVRLLEMQGGVYAPWDVLAGVAELPVAQQRPRVDLRVTGGAVDLSTLDIVGFCRDRGLNPREHGFGEKGDQKWAIDCPWRSDHTDGAQGATSTMIWERGTGRIPAFTCLHAHCLDRRLLDVLAHFGVDLARQHAEVGPSSKAQRAHSRVVRTDEGMPWNR